MQKKIIKISWVEIHVSKMYFFLNLVVVYSDFKLRHLQSSEITYETDLPGSLSESEVDLSSFEARSTSKFSNE